MWALCAQAQDTTSVMQGIFNAMHFSNEGLAHWAVPIDFSQGTLYKADLNLHAFEQLYNASSYKNS